jgi:glucose-induced degradation protein 8
MLRLQLVELIRTCSSTPDGDISPALEFATSQLAPRAPTNPRFLEDLEKTLALLIFPSENLAPQLAALLHPDLRKDIANKVNEAILQNQGARKEARLRNLVKLRAWAEQKAREAKRDIPEHLDLSLFGDKGHNSEQNGISTNAINSSTAQNGNGADSAMTNIGDLDLTL